MDVRELLKYTVEQGASDLHITVGMPATIRRNGKLISIDEKRLTAEDTLNCARQMLNEKQEKELLEKGEVDLSYSVDGAGRFRVNVYRQRGSVAMAIRVVNSRVPSPKELGLPDVIVELTRKKRGLILVTGPTGSGKSTTLASMINIINMEREAHIITLEDPIEYLHHHNKSIVNQREIGSDSRNYNDALRAAMRQDPDVILIGEMRDLETISIAITAAETGHLVLSTLHTIGAAKTIDRIIDVFPPFQQQQIRLQLSTVLQAVISQQLLPRVNGGRVAAIEVMVNTPAISNLIRENKSHQIETSIQTGTKFGMKTMDSDIANLYRNGIITRETALSYAVDKENLLRFL